MNNELFIPTKIKVGFQARQDTYTGKLAYVIPFDGKKWRQEPSWNSWRLHMIDSNSMEQMKRKMYDDRVKTCKSNYEYYKKNVSYRYGFDFENKTLDDYIIHIVGKYEDFKPYGIHKTDDNSFEPKEFDNVPTSGFVLNKKVGGYSSGWNHRSTYCRVYDPRGFEFEIKVDNLLYILAYCDCTKGKGLEGEFVYTWSGKDLVLLPAASPDYLSSTEFTRLKNTSFNRKELTEGHSYKFKDGKVYTYIGKYYVNTAHSDIYGSNIVNVCSNKQSVFRDSKGKFIYDDIKEIAEVVSTDVSNYATYHKEFKESKLYFDFKVEEKVSDAVTEVLGLFNRKYSYYSQTALTNNHFYSKNKDGSYTRFMVEINNDLKNATKISYNVYEYTAKSVIIEEKETVIIKDNKIKIKRTAEPSRYIMDIKDFDDKNKLDLYNNNTKLKFYDRKR